MTVWAILPAAGVGKRMGMTETALPKQYLPLHGATVIEHSLNRLLEVAEIQQVAVALSPQDTHFKSLTVARDSRVTAVTGGEQRQQSVLNALARLSAEADDWILVHDAVRPCVRSADVRKLLDELQHHPIGGLLGAPVEHTLKQVVSNSDADGSNADADGSNADADGSNADDSDTDGSDADGSNADADGSDADVIDADADGDTETTVSATLNRNHCRYALTPQMFRYGILREALEAAAKGDTAFTDESAAVEALGHNPRIVTGAADNIKITYESDLVLAAAILKHQQETQ